MIAHTALGLTPYRRSRQLKTLMDAGLVSLAGNSKLRIYGTLYCASGKRMKADNRVFFINIAKATSNGYRPCGHCMRQAYQDWKALNQ